MFYFPCTSPLRPIMHWALGGANSLIAGEAHTEQTFRLNRPGRRNPPHPTSGGFIPPLKLPPLHTVDSRTRPKQASLHRPFQATASCPPSTHTIIILRLPPFSRGSMQRDAEFGVLVSVKCSGTMPAPLPCRAFGCFPSFLRPERSTHPGCYIGRLGASSELGLLPSWLRGYAGS